LCTQYCINSRLTDTALNLRFPACRYLRPLCALIGIVLILYGLLNVAAMVTLGVDPYRHYRLTALARRNPSPLGPRPPGPGVGGFGLFSSKSKEMGFLQMSAAKDRPTYSNITADSMTLSFPGEVPTSSYNGWYLVTSNESVDHDPVRRRSAPLLHPQACSGHESITSMNGFLDEMPPPDQTVFLGIRCCHSVASTLKRLNPKHSVT
jgi:hypothetical protein